MVNVEKLVDRVLKQFKNQFDLEFNQIVRFLASSIKEDEFFIGRTPKWRAYWIVSETMVRHYGKKSYPVTKKSLRETLGIRSPISNSFTRYNPRTIKLQEKFDEWYDAVQLKKELRENNHHEQSKLEK